MQIGVDATCWGNRRGYGRFTRELFDAILRIDNSNHYLFFVDEETSFDSTLPSSVQKVVVRTKQSPIKAASANGSRSLKDILAMSREVLRHRLDVFFFPAVYSYFPIFNRTKIVVTLHDLIADNHPDLIFNNSKSKLFWRLKQSIAIRQANIIATVSEHSKSEIKKRFELPESRLRVIPEAARPIFRRIELGNSGYDALSKYGLAQDEKFLLYVGGISPHKNLATLIAAFALLSKSTQRDSRLVLVGDYKDDPFLSAYPELKVKITNLKLEERVTFTGFVPDEDLAHLYNAASLLIFPSLDEGFGLPAIEAMSCGTPVVASNCGSLPEIVGDAGMYFDPRDPHAIAQSINKLLADPTRLKEMSERGLERSLRFRWQSAAEETLAVFRELESPAPNYG
jgi:glycosyltransferase involved in cell wall biosynthesis